MRVYCGFKECKWCRDWDEYEEVGICTKEEIELDWRVEGINCGCPDAEWESEE